MNFLNNFVAHYFILFIYICRKSQNHSLQNAFQILKSSHLNEITFLTNFHRLFDKESNFLSMFKVWNSRKIIMFDFNVYSFILFRMAKSQKLTLYFSLKMWVKCTKIIKAQNFVAESDLSNEAFDQKTLN